MTPLAAARGVSRHTEDRPTGAVQSRTRLRIVAPPPSCAEGVAIAARAGHSIRLTGGDVRDRARVLYHVSGQLEANGGAHARCLTSPLTARIAGGSLAGVLPAALLDGAVSATTAAWLRRAVTQLSATAPVVLVDRAEWLDELSALLLAQGVLGNGLAVVLSTGDAAEPPGVLEALEHAGHLACVAVAASDRPGGLTAREREVATLARQGLSSAAIGRRLHLSVRTVDNHLARAYGKLGINSRRQLAGRSL